MTKEEFWRACLAQIQLNISSANFATWFRNTDIVEKKSGELTISVPNNFSKEWLSNKYNKLILGVIRGMDPEVREVKYEVVKISSPPAPPRKKDYSKNFTEDQLEFNNFTVNKETGLNLKYTFDNFVVGPFNELSYAAAQAVCQNPGQTYNPFFIYGGVGLGKTHLLYAIGNEIARSFPKKKIKYLSSEKFTSEVVNSIKNHSVENLKSTYRNIDVLIVDDIQFIAGKEKTQEEFFHTFNALYEKNKQIILSSDRSPNSISALEERLCSRFEGGMITDISLPDYETRMAILRMKAQKMNISSSILEYIASNITRNIRELEGALNQIAGYQKANNGNAVDIEKAKALLKSNLSAPYRKISCKKIIQSVAEFYDLKEKDLLKISRKKEVVRPRQIAMYLVREELKGSFPFIGSKFGGRDHTTAIYACEKISKKITEDRKLKEEMEIIKQGLHKA